MDDLRQRIAARLAELGWSPRHASLEAGLSTHWLRDFLAGKAKSPKLESLKSLANALGVSIEWLTTGQADGAEPGVIRLHGEVGAGAQIVAFDDSFPLEYVDVPPGTVNITGAARVRGDSQYPVYRNGDVIYWSDDVAGVDECIGKECVVTLDDGRVYLKVLERGSSDGLWTLSSHNAAPIRDVRITNLSRVVWQKRA